MTRLELHIEEIVLHGVPAEYADEVAAQVTAHLETLATEDPESLSPLEGGMRDAVCPLGPRTPTTDAHDLGTHVADAVWAAATTGGDPA